MNDLTFTAEDYWSFTEADRVRLNEWVEEHTGIPMDEALVQEVTLGEGSIKVVGIRTMGGRIQTVVIDGHQEAVQYVREYLSHRPPPVWKPRSTPVGNIVADPDT